MPLPFAVLMRPPMVAFAAVGPTIVTVPFCELIGKDCAASFDVLTFVNVIGDGPSGRFAAKVKVIRTNN